MLRRLFVHLSLVLLFAFTQMGAVSHELSHISKPLQQTQPDKNTASEQCAQCIAYAQVASGLQSAFFSVALSNAHFELTSVYKAQLTVLLNASYSARAPPNTSIS